MKEDNTIVILVLAGQMRMNGNMPCSTRSQENQNQCSESDRVFWENVPNPVDIERECLQG